MTSQTSTSKLMNIMARIRFVLAMVKVCKFYILVLLTFPHLTEISLFLISYTFLTFKRIYFQLINLLMIIRFSLNFTLIFFRVKDLHSGKLLLQSPSKGGLYPWPSFPSLKSTPTDLIGEKVSIHQWHNRLGHPAPPLVRRILSKHRLPMMPHKSVQLCPACQQGKLHKLHFGSTMSVSSNPLELLFLDVWGPAPLLSFNNKRYCR